MSKRLFYSLFLVLIPVFYLAAQSNRELYPTVKNRILSPGKTTYYIDPRKGNDQNRGDQMRRPWKTFSRINQLILTAGDKVEILYPGEFRESLVIVAKGEMLEPVRIHFAPGRYDFFPEHAIRKQLFISNTNDDPYGLKAIAILLDSCRFVEVYGANSLFVLRGKMIETGIMHSANILMNGLSYDYERPTVSEIKVTNTGFGFADIKIHKDSKYSIKDSILTWIGEGWNCKPGYLWQKLNVKTNELERIVMPVEKFRFVETGNRRLRVYFPASVRQIPFEKGLVYQNRDITRDCAGIFMERSSNINWKNTRLYFMHGMGVVSQFCENISIDSMIVKPAEGGRRTCSAWADILHFSGCKGKIEISNSYLSAANDDAINVHGTHLKIMEAVNTNQVRVRFMHPQTFGFTAFVTGDSIDFIRPSTLIPYGSNFITHAERLNDQEFLLTLKNSVPKNIHANDVIENSTWTPEVWIHHTTIARIPTRGILLTTRRKAVIEFNRIYKTHMQGILVCNDALSWYESGMVRDLTISNNEFIQCGQEAIAILPEVNQQVDIAVHSGIRIMNNKVELENTKMLKALATSGIQVTGNTIKCKAPLQNIEALIELHNCQQVLINDNHIIQRKP